MKLMIMETLDERPGADVDDGLTATESELAVYSGEAEERERERENKQLDQNGPRAVARPIGEAQHYRTTQYNARTEAELTESAGESGTITTTATVTCSGQCDARVNRGTDELWRCSHRAQDHRGDCDSRIAHNDEM